VARGAVASVGRSPTECPETESHTAVEVGQFSENGLWWWDGTTWIATAQIVLPQLPVTEFEQSGKLKGARGFMGRGSLYLHGNTFISLGLVFLSPG